MKKTLKNRDNHQLSNLDGDPYQPNNLVGWAVPTTNPKEANVQGRVGSAHAEKQKAVKNPAGWVKYLFHFTHADKSSPANGRIPCSTLFPLFSPHWPEGPLGWAVPTTNPKEANVQGRVGSAHAVNKTSSKGRINPLLLITLLCVVLTTITGCQQRRVAGTHQNKLDENYAKSLLYMEIAALSYDQRRPWNPPENFTKAGYGVVIAPNMLLTTAWNIFDSSYIKCKAKGTPDYFEAKVKVVDYQLNLALLEFDPAAFPTAQPITFNETIPIRDTVRTVWITEDATVMSQKGEYDRAEIFSNSVSFNNVITYIVENIALPSGSSRIVTQNGQIIGLAAWSESTSQEMGVIPSATINAFLTAAMQEQYHGFGWAGFHVEPLNDPVRRDLLGLVDYPEKGVIVSDVLNMGTASDVLQKNDVIIIINGYDIDTYGKFQSPQYGRIGFNHLLVSSPAGSDNNITIIRDKQAIELNCKSRHINADQMLIPYYAYDKKPTYFVTGGFIFRPLTRDYLTIWGEDWYSKAPTNLMIYFFGESFKPTKSRKEIVILSEVLPAMTNLGYHQLSNAVVSKVDNYPVESLQHMYNLIESAPGPFITIEFEQHEPLLVLPKEQLPQINEMLNQAYGVGKPENLE